MLAAKRVHDGDPQGRTKLAVAAEKVADAAANGDLAAFREMADRIDGKAPQALDVTTYDGDIAERPDSELEAIIRAGRSGNGTAAPKAGASKPH